ncbi:MAG: hypothetical protein FJ291_14830 [Planctomycetes bacterium]|nr:hypothetical protein [Planctomycetota bacterium]
MAALGAFGAVTAAADELLPFLFAHQKASALAVEKKWQEAAKAYGAFAAERGEDPCAPLAAALQGIILRRELDQPAQAREAFLRAAKAPDTPFGRAVRELARGWLARLQMEQLDAALRRYWADKIEYPEKLDGLVARKLAAPELLVDPWGKPFAYATRPLKARPDLPRQVYTLACTAIEEDSRGLKAAFAHTLAFPKRFQLKAIGGVKPLVALLAFEDKTKKAVNVVEGEKVDGATLVRLTPQGAILIGGCSVAVLAK